MYYRRVPLPAGGLAAAATPFGPVGTNFRRRCAKLLAASLPILFALASFGPSDLLTGVVPHAPGHPVTSVPDEALRHLITLDRTTFPVPTESWTRLPYPDMSISVPPPADEARMMWEGAGEPAAAGSKPGQPAAPPPPPPPPAPSEAGPRRGGGVEGPAAAAGGGAGEEGFGAARRRRQRQQQRQQEQQQQRQRDAVPGAAGGPAGPAGARPPDLETCSISALAGPLMQVLKAHSHATDRDLRRNAQLKARVYDAVLPVRQRLSETRQQLRELDAQRVAAAGRGEYDTAAALRSRMDELAVQIDSMEATSRTAQDELDAMAEVDSAVRQRQAGQLLWLSSELRSVAQAAEGTIRRLQGELQRLHTQLETATEARASIGQALSTSSQSSEVRRELRSLAAAALAAERRAAAALEADRVANRAVLSDAAALASNLSSADSLLHSTSLELALMRGQVALALEMQDYEQARRLSAAMTDLRGAHDDSAGSVVTLEKLLAAHEAVVRQRLSDFRHHLTALERASELVQFVQDLRDMYGSAEVDEREALSLAGRLSAALEELRNTAGEPPRLLRSEEAEAVVREVLA